VTLADITEQFRLDGKAALVTGAGKGIGKGIALAFARAGADVALVARTKDDLEAVAAEIRSIGRNAVTIPADVTDIEGLEDVVDQTARALGGLDILVNNAGGVEQLGTYTSMTVAILENAFRFNVSAPFELGRHALPHMLARGAGAIVNIGSMSGMQNERGFLPYSLAKSALAKFTQLAAIELAPRVRVNAILPGCVETEALRGFMDAMPDVRAGLQSKTPMRRNGTPDDIAAAALFLASPAASWITGKLLEVDGAAPAGLFPNDSPDL
jgi:7-alpha-hydroxysteroid dehydrogenase